MIIINQQTDDTSPGLAARKIWKELFKTTKAWEWEDIDSFLCDLKIFENIVQALMVNVEEKKVFYWTWDKSGYTEVIDYRPPRLFFMITVNRPTGKRNQWNITIE